MKHSVKGRRGAAAGERVAPSTWALSGPSFIGEEDLGPQWLGKLDASNRAAEARKCPNTPGDRTGVLRRGLRRSDDTTNKASPSPLAARLNPIVTVTIMLIAPMLGGRFRPVRPRRWGA